MRARIRWITFEALKVTLVLTLFVWVQGGVVDTKYEAYAKTGQITLLQESQEDRLRELEAATHNSEANLDEAVREVRKVQRDLSRQKLDGHEGQDRLAKLIDDRTHELRSMIEHGLGRVEGASHNASAYVAEVEQKYDDLRDQIERRPAKMKRRMVYPIVQLRGNGTVGSGVVIQSQALADGSGAETYVLTAHHVVLEILGSPGSTRIDDLRFMDASTDLLQDRTYSAELLAFQEDVDIALLRVEQDEPWRYVAELTPNDRMRAVQMFEQVYAVGCPLGNKPMPTPGEVSSLDKEVAGQNFWMINAPTFFGNSGGGVFLNESGYLIGISSMIYTYGKQQPMVVPHMGLFVPLETVLHWLRDEGYGHVISRDAEVATSPATAFMKMLDAAVETGLGE